MEHFIQLEKDNILRLPIKTSEGKETGEFLEFDLEDIEMPLKYQELLEKDKKNRSWLRNQFAIINKREDVKGKKLLSKNEEDMYSAMKTFLQREVETYNMFLGENGVQKILNGRKLGWTSLQMIDEIIVNQIIPLLDTNMKSVAEHIKEKYGFSNMEKDVLKDDE